MSRKTYKVGLVGLGRIASSYEKDKKARRHYPALTHAGSFNAHSRTHVIWGADPDTGRRRDFARRWGVRLTSGDHRELLAEHPPDILSVCSPAVTHREVIEAAAGRVSLIFCEKPLGVDTADVQAIVDVCRSRGTLLSVNFYRLFDPSHLKIKEFVARHLGEVQRVNCFYGKGLANMGSHIISLLIYYFGEPVEVRQLGFVPQQSWPEPTPDVYLKFAAGFPAVLQAVDFDYYRLFEIDVIGTKGRVIIDEEGLNIRAYRVAPNVAESGAYQLVEREAPRSTVGSAMYWAVDNLVAALDGRAALRSTGEDYIKVQRVMDEASRGV